MSRFDDYPYSQIREALGTVFGRVALVAATMLAGCMLGGLTAMRSFEGLWIGLSGFAWLGLSSLFSGPGFLVFPLLFIFTLVFVRLEWPLWLTVVCTVLMWWNIHRTVRWNLYDSPMAKLQAEMAEQSEKRWKEALKQEEARHRK